jgi:hypothetical protein
MGVSDGVDIRPFRAHCLARGYTDSISTKVGYSRNLVFAEQVGASSERQRA